MSELTLNRDALKYAADIAEAAVASGTHPCAAIAVASSRETIWTHLVSGADAIAEDTIFLLASISKPITATAVMRLVERGRLLLSLPVVHYIPEFGANGKHAVTPWHLLTHASGINETRWAMGRFAGEGDVGPCIEEACSAFLNFEPGTRCEYCTLSYAVLAELITRQSGIHYTDYLREQVFLPLGMRDTAFRPAEMRRAAPVHDFGPPEHAERLMARAVAGGGLWSTLADLVAFGQAYLRGGTYQGYPLLSPASIALMTRHQTEGMTLYEGGYPTRPADFGLGWGKPSRGEMIGSPGAYEHGGATGTRLYIDPEYDLIVVFLTNRWGLESDTPKRIVNAVLGALRRERAAPPWTERL